MELKDRESTGRINTPASKVEPFRPMLRERAQVKRWKQEIEQLTRSHNDRLEAAKQYQRQQEMAAEKARRKEEEGKQLKKTSGP